MTRIIDFHKPYISQEEIDNVIETLKSGWLTMGLRTFDFENSFASYLGVKHAIALNSCTAALHLSLRVLEIKENDEVIIPAINFASAGEVCIQQSAIPIIVDVNKDDGNISLEAVSKAINKRTKAIIPVHYGGNPCDMDDILDIARKNNIHVIEDAAHALPSFYKNKKVGTLGDIACFSFYATKTLTTCEGGMVVTSQDEWAEKMKVLRLHGISKDAWKRYAHEGDWYYEIVDYGYKYNMSDIQAAIGLAQLNKLEWMWKKRLEIAERYYKYLGDVEEIQLPVFNRNCASAWHLFPIFLRLERLKIDRKAFMQMLKLRGIGTSVHFIPLYRHPFYRKNFNYDPKDFPNSEWFYEREVSLPIYPSLSEEEQLYIIENIIDICKKARK